MALQILTANGLDKGEVVYFTAAGSWSTDLNDARVVEDDDSAAALEKTGFDEEASNRIVGPYLLPVERDGDQLTALSVREKIRAVGPSV